MNPSRSVLAAATLLGAAAGAAAAEPIAVGDARMTVPAKQGVLHLQLTANLAEEQIFKPFSIAPDLWYGATDRLTVGVIHSGRAATGFFGGAGAGLCLAGEDNGCDKVYDSAGLLVRYHLKDGPFTVAADGGLIATSFDPFTVALKAGIAARWSSGKIAIDLAPNLWFGLNERAGGNEERIHVPVTVTAAVAPSFALAVQSGVAAPVEDLSDNAVIPLSVGGEVLVGNHLLVDVAFSLPALLDNNDETEPFDARALTLGVGYAF